MLHLNSPLPKTLNEDSSSSLDTNKQNKTEPRVCPPLPLPNSLLESYNSECDRKTLTHS
jgi:hypothetical protein